VSVNGTCRKGDEPLTNEGWIHPQPERCFFYPARDCPGWSIGGRCSRIGDEITEEIIQETS
jgi:hypothetical protein